MQLHRKVRFSRGYAYFLFNKTHNYYNLYLLSTVQVLVGVSQEKKSGRHIVYESTANNGGPSKLYFFTEKQKHYIKDIYRFSNGTECTYDIIRSWNHGPWIEPQYHKESNTMTKQEQRDSRRVNDVTSISISMLWGMTSGFFFFYT